jgi:Flp pilus assembly protein TadG
VPRKQDQRGQSLVEFAVLLPLVVLVVMGAIDFGRVFFAYTTIVNAAHQGAMCASVGSAACPGGAAAAANAEIGTTLPGGITTTVAGGGGAPGSTVTVTVTYNFDSLTTAVFATTTLPVKASASMVIQ